MKMISKACINSTVSIDGTIIKSFHIFLIKPSEQAARFEILVNISSERKIKIIV